MSYHLVHSNKVVASGERKILRAMKRYKKVQYPANVFRLFTEGQLRGIGIYNEVRVNHDQRDDPYKEIVREDIKYNKADNQVTNTLVTVNKKVAGVRNILERRIDKHLRKLESNKLTVTLSNNSVVGYNLDTFEKLLPEMFTAHVNIHNANPDFQISIRDDNGSIHNLSSILMVELWGILHSKVNEIHKYSWSLIEKVNKSTLAQLKSLDIEAGWPIVS